MGGKKVSFVSAVVQVGQDKLPGGFFPSGHPCLPPRSHGRIKRPPHPIPLSQDKLRESRPPLPSLFFSPFLLSSLYIFSFKEVKSPLPLFRQVPTNLASVVVYVRTVTYYSPVGWSPSTSPGRGLPQSGLLGR